MIEHLLYHCQFWSNMLEEIQRFKMFQKIFHNSWDLRVLNLWIFFISEISKTVDMYLFLFDDILLLTKVKKHPRKVKHLMWFLHKDKFYWKHLLNELLKNRYRESNATCFSCALNVPMRPFEICLKQQEHCIIKIIIKNYKSFIQWSN